MEVFYKTTINCNGFDRSIDLATILSNSGEIKIGMQSNYKYDIIKSNKLIGLIDRNYVTDFIFTLEHECNDELFKSCYDYKIIVFHTSYYSTQVEFTIYYDKNILIERIKNDNILKNESELIKHIVQTLSPKKHIDNLWKEKSVYQNYKTIQPKKLNIKLKQYQIDSLNRMKEIEFNKSDNKLETTTNLCSIPYSGDEKNAFWDNENRSLFENLPFDTYDGKFNSNICNYYYSSGGILADEMGLGKTITTISLIIEKPYIYKPNIIDEDFKIETEIIHEITGVVSKATLILCPSHLTKQWSLEITKANKDLNQISFLTKVNHEKYTYQDILDADIVIVSFEFLKNIKYYANYANLKDNTMPKYTPSMLSDTRSARFKNIRSLFSLTKDNINSKSNNVILEAIKWHRIVIDEGHEIYKYGYVYGYDDDYLRIFIRNLRCTNKWFVSGTPFYDKKSLINVAQFLDFKVNIKVGGNTYELDLDKAISRGLTETNIYNSILRQIYIRNTMEHVKDQINEIPPANLENIFLDLSEFENSLYMSLKICNSESYLRQLCCNIQISDKFSNGNFDKIMNFNEVKEKLIQDNEDKIKKTEHSIQHLDITLPGWQARKQMLENIITSSKYLLASFKNTIEVKSECCPICRCDFDNPVVTECGHNFCYECITEVLSISAYKRECPICRQAISASKIYKLENKMEVESEKVDELIYKYGTKIAKLIKMCNQILLNQNNKIIIFSEWDRLLSMIGIVLKENEINNVFCKGNVHQRNAAIGAFRSELSKKRKNISNIPRVIMLSTEHAASGTNLTEATHIIFMEPHIGEYGAVKAMEDQAIGRAVRLGQTNQVNVYRLITKNTIEDDVINKYLQGLDTIADDTNNNQSNNQIPIDI